MVSVFVVTVLFIGFAKKVSALAAKQSANDTNIPLFTNWPRENFRSLLISFKLGIGNEEIQRQNRITAQIVANYLERRLFPFKRPTHRLPTVDEILPSTTQLHNGDRTAESKMKITRQLNHGSNAPSDDDLGDEDYTNDDDNNEQDNDPNDPENLQSVESNHVDSYYPEMNESVSNENEGRFQFFFY